MLLLVVPYFRKNRQTVKLTPGSSGRTLPGRYTRPSVEKRPNRPHIPSIRYLVKQQRNKKHGRCAILATPRPVVHSKILSELPSAHPRRFRPSLPAFPPSVKRYLGAQPRGRKQKNARLSQKLHNALIYKDKLGAEIHGWAVATLGSGRLSGLESDGFAAGNPQNRLYLRWIWSRDGDSASESPTRDSARTRRLGRYLADARNPRASASVTGIQG